MKKLTIGVVGNPNCGKTTLFNLLTGAKQRVGNWPGVTVDRKTGSYKHSNRHVEVIDTPGIYSLSAVSVDEKVAAGYVLSREYDLIVNIVDASNIERNLYLTSQLLEMKVPVLLALNMMDMASEKMLEINVPELQKRLGCPVVPMIAARGQGKQELLQAINTFAQNTSISPVTVTYPDQVVQAAQKLEQALAPKEKAAKYDPFWLAIKLLEDDELAISIAGEEMQDVVLDYQDEIEEELDEDVDILIASARYELINSIVSGSVKKIGQASAILSDKIDQVVLHKVFGLPIFFLAMYLMFMFTINLGGAFIDFFDIFFGVICVDWFGEILAAIKLPEWDVTLQPAAGGEPSNFILGGNIIPEWAITLLAGGLGGALQTIATFIPPIGFMFLALSFLEDSGYMARAAFVMDRAMRVIGLPGKAFIPMLVGFGCNVPAIMATRTMENQRDRILAVAMNPFMSCGARLPVYALFAAVFFPKGGQNLVFILYLTGIGFAVITGLVLKNTLLKGQVSPFVMELPPYHLPTFKAVILRAWDRLSAFLKRASKILIPVIIVLSFLNALGTDGSFGHEDTESSVLASVGKSITPFFKPMGLTDENWPATVGLFTGIFAKEAVVGTLDALYERGADGETENDGGEVDVLGGIKEAFGTIPANLTDMLQTFADPLGIAVDDVDDVETAAEDMEVSTGTFIHMKQLFGSTVAALAYLLFVLLYFPCAAAIAAVYRETNLRWTLFVGAWTTGMAYFSAIILYQAGTYQQHPASSLAWIISLLLAFAGIVLTMAWLGLEGRTSYRLKLVKVTAN